MRGVRSRAQYLVANLRPGRRAPWRDVLRHDEPMPVLVARRNCIVERPPAAGHGVVWRALAPQRFGPGISAAFEDHQQGIFATMNTEARDNADGIRPQNAEIKLGELPEAMRRRRWISYK